MVTDPLSPQERSALMAKVRSRGNRSTEGRVEGTLKEHSLTNWTKHPKDVPGTPDFYFPAVKLAVFVHGCFWHGCPACNRNVPKTRTSFWRKKIDENRRRDQRVRRQLWRQGYHVFRVWEHDLKRKTWILRLLSTLRRLEPG